MKILDTKKAKEKREAEANDERERREFQEWLDSAVGTPAPSADDLGKLWDPKAIRTTSTMSPERIKEWLDSLRKTTSTMP